MSKRPSWSAQAGFDRRFDWGLEGARRFAGIVDVLVVVDVLSFSTAVDVAVARGATVIPTHWRNSRAADLAGELGAELAVGRSAMTANQPYSLSPASLEDIPPGTKLVLPSPNGAAIAACAARHGVVVLAGCLRNATAVGEASAAAGTTVGVIAAGERWPDGSLRPALEDMVGAGAILDALGGQPSPEALAAIAVARAATPELLGECASARELVALGYPTDVAIATAVNSSFTAPRFDDGAFGADMT